MECNQGAQRAIRRLDMRIVANAIKQHQVGAREPLSATFDHLVSGNPAVAADDYAQWNVRLGQGAQPASPVREAFCDEEIQRTHPKLETERASGRERGRHEVENT